VIRTRKAGAEKIVTKGGKMHQALTFGEKEPTSGGRVFDHAASGRETLRSGGIRAGDH